MASRDLVTEIKIAAGTESTAIDTYGFNSLTIACLDADATFTLTDCDTSNGSFADVASEFVIDGGDRAVGYAGTKRYVKFADSGEGTSYVVILGHPVVKPVAED